MAFRSRDLSVLAYANGFTLWHYRTEDGFETLMGGRPGRLRGSGYFDSACELLRAGDRLMVNLPQDGRVTMVDLIVTAVGADGTVAVAPSAGCNAIARGIDLPAARDPAAACTMA